jgi:hypothetical protein
MNNGFYILINLDLLINKAIKSIKDYDYDTDDKNLFSSLNIISKLILS